MQVQVLFRARYVPTRTERVILSGIYFFFLLIPFCSSYSQSPDLRSAFQKGKEAMILGEYAKAIQHFETWTLAMPR
ncbi:MAG: hypothetical protein ACK55I_41225, partial [bacterium]